MATSTLVLHRGAQAVTPEQLREYRAPEPQGRWHPIPHSRVLDVVSDTLTNSGYAIKSMKLGVTPNGMRFFGTLDLATPLHGGGVSLAVGIRNSNDQTFPISFCAGNRVFCCDNLSFHSELMVSRKHTTHGARRFTEAIARAVGELSSFKDMEGERIRRFMNYELSDEQADSLILRSFERGLIGHRDLATVIKEWRTPSFPEFESRTTWSLLNAFTSALRDRAMKQPASYAKQTQNLNYLLDCASKVPPLQLAV